MIIKSMVFVLLGGLFLGCNTPRPEDATKPSEPSSLVARVKVAQDGTIYLNRRPVSLEELKVELTKLREGHGVVLYYREGGEESADKRAEVQGLEVIRMVAQLQLPLKKVEQDFD